MSRLAWYLTIAVLLTVCDGFVGASCSKSFRTSPSGLGGNWTIFSVTFLVAAISLANLWVHVLPGLLGNHDGDHAGRKTVPPKPAKGTEEDDV